MVNPQSPIMQQNDIDASNSKNMPFAIRILICIHRKINTETKYP